MMEEAYFARKVPTLEAFIFGFLWCCDNRQVTPFGSRDSLHHAPHPFADKAVLSPSAPFVCRNSYSYVDILDDGELYCA